MIFTVACGGTPGRGGATTSTSVAEPAQPVASTPRVSATPVMLLDGATSVTRLAVASLCALPGTRRELDQLSAEDPAGSAPMALACEVERVVVIVGPGDAMRGLIATRAPMSAWAERVAVLRGTTLTWSSERRARLDSASGDDWELRLVGEHLLAFWLADGPDGAVAHASEEDLAALIGTENESLLASEERLRDGRRSVRIRADLSALVDVTLETMPTSEWIEEHRSRLLRERWLEDAGSTLQVDGQTVHVETRANAAELATIPMMGGFMLSGRPLFGGSL